MIIRKAMASEAERLADMAYLAWERDLRPFLASEQQNRQAERRRLHNAVHELLDRTIVAERDGGTPVLLVSTELDEVAALADRIAVMYRGRVVGVVPADTPRDVLGLMMAGVPHAEAAAGAASAAGSSAHPAQVEQADRVVRP